MKLRGFEFLVSAKYYGKIEWQKIININVFGCKNKQFYAMYVSKQHNEHVLNLLRIAKDENQHYVLIKDFNNMIFNNTKHKERKCFCMHCLQCFSSPDINQWKAGHQDATKRKQHVEIAKLSQCHL